MPEDYFQLALDSLSDGFWILDAQCRLVFLNRAARALLERISPSAAEVRMGDNIRAVLPAGPGARLYAACLRAQSEAAPVVFTDFFALFNSQPWQCEVEISPTPNGFTVVMRKAQNGSGETSFNLADGASARTDGASARKRSENAQAALAAIVASSEDAIVGKTLDGTITSWNRGAENLFGYQADEVIGQNITLLIPEERQDEEPAILAAVRQGKTLEHYEAKRRTKNGRLIDVSITISPIRDSEGHIIGASKIARGVTGRRKAEAELHAVLTNARCILWRAEVWAEPQEAAALAAGAEAWHNFRWHTRVQDEHAAQQVLHLEIPDGLNYTDCWARSRHPDDGSRINRTARHALMANLPNYAQEFRCFDKFGRLIWLHEETAIVTVQPGNWQLFGVATDVTERKQAEVALQQNAALFSALVEQAPTGLYVVDAQFRLQQVNAKALPVFASVQPLIGRDFNEVVETLWGTEVGRQCADIFRHTLTTGETYVSPRFSEMRQDINTEQAYEWEIHRVTLPDGQHGVVCYFQDVTERYRHERNLLFLTEMQKIFATLSSAEEIMRVAAMRVAEHLNLTHCLLVEINETTDQCTVLHDHHVPEATSLVGEYRIGDFHTAEERRLLASGGTLIINDVHRQERSAERIAQFDALGIGAMVNASYVADGRWKFILSAPRAEPYDWPTADVELLSELAARIYMRIERARAEDKLRESEERLRLFIEHAPAALAMFDREMRYLSVSHRWRQDFGLGEGDLRGLSHYEVFPEVPEAWKEIHRRALSGEVISNEQDPFTRADGSVQWLKWEVHPWRDAAGDVAGLLIFSEDITARKTIEEEFRLASERFAAALKASPIAVFNQDLELRYTWMHNPPLGLHTSELIGKRAVDIQYRVEDATQSEAVKRRVLASGQGERAQITVHTHGVPHYFDLTVEPLRDTKGRITGVTCAAVDITQQRQLQENLRRQAHLLDEAHDAIFAWELDGTIVYWNQGAERLYGYPSAQVIGQNCHQLLQSAQTESQEEVLAALMHEGVWMGEIEHTAQGGRRFSVASRHSLVREEDGRMLVIEANRDITQRKQAENELRESEERLRATFEQAAVGIALLDLNGNWLRVNERLCNIVGYTREELLAKTFADITHPDDVEADWAQVRRLLEGEISSYQMEKRYICKNGAIVWINLTAALRRRADGTADYFISVIEDISARKQIEFDLRESEARFRRVSEMISDFAYELRILPDGSVVPVWFTDALPKITGRSFTELHDPDSWRSFTHPDDAPLVAAHQATLARGEADSCEFRIISADGSVRWLRDYSQPLFDESGTLIGIHGGAQDITESKKSERAAHFLAAASPALSASLDYAETLENLTQLCVPELADFCLTFVFIDNAAPQTTLQTGLYVARHTRPEKQELVRRFHQRFPESGPPLAALRAGQSVLRSKVGPQDWEKVAQSPEHLEMLQNLQPRSILMVPLMGENGFVGSMTLAVTESERSFDAHDRDLAEEVARRASLALERARLFHQMQAAREAAENANRTKDQFLSVASHELRTPLTPILGWVDIMRSPIDEELKMHALNVLERNVRAQMQLVDDILDVSRITSGKLRLNMQPLDLTQIVTGAVDSVWPTATARNLQLFVSATDKPCQVRGDAGRLQQVVWNLLSNAIKFSVPEGTIEVELNRDRTHAVISVRDRGIGIAPEFLPHVFERFRQADSSHTRQHGGLGLGLSITQHITELHGGSIHAVSEGKDLGAIFTVRLPLLEDFS